jgi:hypothetical protein
VAPGRKNVDSPALPGYHPGVTTAGSASRRPHDHGEVIGMDLYRRPTGAQTRWASFENPEAAKGRAGMTNRGAKGAAFDAVAAGQSRTLLDVTGSGLLTRVWMTIDDRSPAMLRSLRLEMFWDDSPRPAVSVPLGDFFGTGLGRMAVFECALLSNPEGRSLNCCIPMPFRTAARVTLTNESATDLTRLFYDVDLLLDVPHGDDALYFHAGWRRESPNALGVDFEILPRVQGQGRYLGCNVGVIAQPAYQGAWWGEGEVKVWLDGDGEFPTLCGTGTEDYIGTGWGQGQYAHRAQGCTVADRESRQWAFYRYHLDDPIFFHEDCRVAIQTIGGGPREQVADLLAAGVRLLPVSLDAGGGRFIRLRELPEVMDLSSPEVPDGWVNFHRQDDWSATAYLYLDRPEGAFPPLAEVGARTAGLG